MTTETMNIVDIEEGDALRYRFEKVVVEDMSPPREIDPSESPSPCPRTVQRDETVIVKEAHPEIDTVVLEKENGSRLIEASPDHLYKL